MGKADAMWMVCLAWLAGCNEQVLNTTETTEEVGPRITVTPGAVDFGEVRLSEIGSALVTVGNDGNAGLSIDEIGIAGSPSFSWSWPDAIDVLPAGETTDLVVEYRPSAANETGWLQIHSNDPVRTQVDVPLSGSAAYGLLRIQPDPVDFTGMQAGDIRIESAILVNVGGDALTIDSLAVLGQGFAIESQPALPLTLDAGESADGLELSFTSLTDGMFAGQLHAHSDAPIAETTAELLAFVGFGNITGRICGPDGSSWVGGVHVWVEGTYPDGTPWFVEAWTDAQGNFTLENVPTGVHTVHAERGSWSTSFDVTLTGGTYEIPVPECLDPASAKVAVVTGEYDHIQTVLDSLQIEYDLYDGLPGSSHYTELLTDPDQLADYDIVFFNCGMSFSWLGQRSTIAGNLRTFVANGGSVYASDWAWGLVEESWPDAIDFYGTPDTPWDPNTYASGPFNPYNGVATSLSATVSDPTMAGSVGDTASIVFDLDAWVVPYEPGNASVMVSGDVTVYSDLIVGTRSAFDGAPLVLRYQQAGGTVIYTAFHNDQQATADARAILAEIILSL